MRVQVEGEKDYNEDQVALFIPDLTAFGMRVLISLGTPTINQIVNVIKDSEIDELSMSLSGSRISHLLVRHQAELFLKDDTTASQTPDPIDLNKSVKTIKWEEIEVFHLKLYKVIQRWCCWVTIYM